jgi:hypothetical protein
LSSHLCLRGTKFGCLRNSIGGAHLARAVALGVVLCLTPGAASTIVWGAQNTPPAASQSTAPKTRATTKQEATPPSPKGLSYHTMTDRTAVWVGDQFHYLITVDYTPDYEFVLDNLNKENVNMDPFPVIDVQKTVTPYGANQSRLVVDMTLANFSLIQTDARIPQISLYYFRRDQHTGGAEQAAAESLAIVGPTIALRSTLPANPPDIRDAISTVGWPSSRWVVPAVGYTALALLLAWLGLEVLLFVRMSKTNQGLDRRVSMEAVRTLWARRVPSDFSDGKVTKEFLDRSYQNVKEYLGYYLDSDAASLTADEVSAEMRRSGASGDITEKVSRVLSACETARYSENGTTMTPESARGIAQDVRELMNLAPKE